jgi:hypothetical protein
MEKGRPTAAMSETRREVQRWSFPRGSRTTTHAPPAPWRPASPWRRGPFSAAASLAAATKRRQEFSAAVENVPAWQAKFPAHGRIILSPCAAVRHSPALFAPHQPRRAPGRPFVRARLRRARWRRARRLTLPPDGEERGITLDGCRARANIPLPRASRVNPGSAPSGRAPGFLFSPFVPS